MNSTEQNASVMGIPKQAFEQFLGALEKKEVSIDVINRLRKTLIETGDVSEAAVKEALFGEGNTGT